MFKQAIKSSAFGNLIGGLAIAVLVVAGSAGTAFGQQKKSEMPPRPVKPAIDNSMARIGGAKIPFLFEKNAGQADKRARFVVRRSGYNVFLTPTSLVTVLGSLTVPAPEKPGAEKKPVPSAGTEKSYALHMQMVGARDSAKIDGLEAVRTRASYFTGNDPSKWIRGIELFKGVRYEGLYRDIDMLVGTDGGTLSYHFVVGARGNHNNIRMRFTGIDSASIEDNGRLRLRLANGRDIIHHPPQVFEIGDNDRTQLDAGFEMLSNDTVGFRIAKRTKGKTLIIDPVIDFATYFGGSSAEPVRKHIISLNDLLLPALDMDTDRQDRLLLGGATLSADLPDAAGPISPAPYKGFIARLDPSGPSWDYVTYVGGTNSTFAYGVSAGANGNAYLCGETISQDFPLPGTPFDSTFNIGAISGFVLRFDNTGAPAAGTFIDPAASTYVYACEYHHGIGSGRHGEVYLTGQTWRAEAGDGLKSEYYQASAFQNTFGGTATFPDAYVAALSHDLSSLQFFTLHGGSFQDVAVDISVRGREAYITGVTESYDFPITDGGSGHTLPLDQALACEEYFNTYRCYEGFVVRFETGGTGRVYSTMLGDDGLDMGYAIDAGQDGSAYVSGRTKGGSLGTSATVTKLSPAGTLVYRTQLGALDAIAYDIEVDRYGNAYTVGELLIGWQAVGDALSTDYQGGPHDGFYAVLDTAGQTVYLTYLGGEEDDRAYTLARDSQHCAYIGLETWSDNLNVPLAGAPQNARAGASDVLIVRHCTPPNYENLVFNKEPIQGILGYGDIATIRITIDNPDITIPGPFTITDNILLPLKALSVSGPGCSLSGQTVTCELNAIPSGITGILIEAENRWPCARDYEGTMERTNVAILEYPDGTERFARAPFIYRLCASTLFEPCDVSADCSPGEVCYQGCSRTEDCIFGIGRTCIGRIENTVYGPKLCVRDPIIRECDRVF